MTSPLVSPCFVKLGAMLTNAENKDGNNGNENGKGQPEELTDVPAVPTAAEAFKQGNKQCNDPYAFLLKENPERVHLVLTSKHDAIARPVSTNGSTRDH